MSFPWTQRLKAFFLAVLLLCSGLMFALSGPLPAAHATQLTQQDYTNILTNTWKAYKRYYIQGDGRVIDASAQGITTSEGQAYALLRAIWMKDKDTFDKVYEWTVNNLRTRSDKLFAWKWGRSQQQNHSVWGVLDQTAATDADQDIALALLMAHRLWQSDSYKTEAIGIIQAIWDHETVESPIGRILLPGDWHYKPEEKQIRLNPSYYAPYAYRLFALYDKSHPWMTIVDTSYKLLEIASQQTGTHLPPDWMQFSLENGSVMMYGWDDPLDVRSDYGYEAIRCHWRIALDYLLNPQDPRSQKWLKDTNWYLVRHWRIRNTLPGLVTIDGIERDLPGSTAIYGPLLPALAMGGHQEAADVILDRWILGPLNRVSGLWEPRGDYYAQNWLWFGFVTYTYQQRHGIVELPTDKKAMGEELLRRLTFLLD